MTVDAAPAATRLLFDRPPATPDELWEAVRIMWGIEIPRTRVCPGHSSPFDAFCEGYFGNRGNYALWYGSRGTGKSLMLAILGLTKTALLGINATLLGGSMAQSQNVHEHVEQLMRAPYAPRHAVARQIQTELAFNEGNWIRPLPASQRTVRGPHPQLVLLDEIDEMDYDVYTAAQGQAMAKPNTKGVVVPEMTIASSTWQNPVGCMALGTPITTPNGDKPIEDIVPGDLVMTRDGWKPVLHSWDMGHQPTVTVEFASGRSITCTPWHPIWTDSHGWVRADSLPLGASACLLRPVTLTTPQMPAAALAEPLRAMPVDAELAGLAVGPANQSSTLVVGDRVHQVQMSGVHTVLHPAGVVQDHSLRDRSNNPLVYPTVSQVSPLASATPVVLHPVPGVVDTQRPQHTVVGRQADGHTFEADQVVAVHTGMVRATWDLTVRGTHEYVAGGILTHNTFKTVYDAAQRNGLSVHTWCFREVIKPHGWLDPEFIERKRLSVPAEMFRVEYELGEPAGDSRAFDLAKLNEYFIDMKAVDHRDQANDRKWVFERPNPEGIYAAGVDWAKSVDNTVMTVVRTDVQPWRTVYLRIMNRRPWPYMIEQFNQLVTEYQAVSAHDATGLGNVVHDLVDERTMKVVMMGTDRVKLLTDYISAVEQGRYHLPRNTPLFDAHKGVTVDEVFAPGKWNSHLADEVAACAIAHRAATRMAPPASGMVIKRDPKDPPLLGWQKAVNGGSQPEATIIAREGDVVEIDERSDVSVFWL